MWFVLIIAVVVLVLVAWVALRMRRGRRLSPGSAQRYRSTFEVLKRLPDAHRRVLEAEKVVDSAMFELGVQGNFADKLKKAGPRFRDVQSLWNAHKLRNRIAHEMNLAVPEGEMQRAVAAFEKALEQLS